ncbi:MAG: thioredoxin family protein [Porticoccus sp.]|jgi:hypothetical protein|nr:thioredoxin family protein [Porticoccus sp.]
MQHKVIMLYVGSNCHLCDEARFVLMDVLKDIDLKLKYSEVDVSNNDILTEKYGLRIPVVVMPNGKEKDWPFTTSQIKRLL